jgi:CheY-like chemotaxis protein
MREVIKIAFRRENINVVACHDAALALVEIEKTRPDIVITDVIMPDKDGYDVCQFIKSHPELAKIPVVLMSGVVNRAVAEKAFAVKADELLRKPFQPQDLIARVKHLLNPNGTPKPTPAAAATAAAALSSIFTAASPSRPAATAAPSQRAVALIDTPAVLAPPTPSREPAPGPGQAPTQTPQPARVLTPPAPPVSTPALVPTIAPKAAQNPLPAPTSTAPSAPGLAPAAAVSKATAPLTPVAAAPAQPALPLANPAAPAAKPANGNGNEAATLKIEILRLEGLVRKLQSELQAEREYARSLELHVKSLQEAVR